MEDFEFDAWTVDPQYDAAWEADYTDWSEDGRYDYAPLGEPTLFERMHNACTVEPHACTADCFTFADRSEDPTIDDHFNRFGPHVCEGRTHVEPEGGNR